MPAILDGIFESLFKNPLVSTYWKDKDGSYKKINANFLTGYDSVFQEQDIIGRKDIDLWDGHAPSFHVNDQRVIYHEKKEVFIEDHFFGGRKRFYMSCKSPWYAQSGKLLGIAGASFLLNPDDPVQDSYDANQLTELLEIIHSIYFKKTNFQHTKRQAECLSYLAKGMSLKQIASALGLSPRTVEHYLDAVKMKLNCANRYELVKKAIELRL